MGSIFASADSVLVWLGEETPEVQGVLQFLIDWWSAPIPDHVDWRSAKIRWTSSSSMSFSRDTLNEGAITSLRFQQEHLGRILHLFARPWWRRKWVIQELVQARTAFLVLDRSTLEWARIEFPAQKDNLEMAYFQFLLYVLMDYPDPIIGGLVNVGIQNASHLGNIVRNSIAQGQNTHVRCLATLMHLTDHFDCTEPRDHLYSMLGIASDLDDSNSQLLRVDYNASLEHISTNLCRWIMENNHLPLLDWCKVASRRGCCL